MRTKLIVANWKMNYSVTEALKFLAAFHREINEIENCEVVFCPPFTALYAMEETLEGTPFKVGAQNMHWEDSGAFTGEISPFFLKEMGVQYVILGHSERRQLFGETDGEINKKLMAALHQNIIPIVCVGETDKEHKEGKTFDLVNLQMKKALEGQNKTDLPNIIWAYEPIWAIGTGKNATPEQAQEVIQSMRKELSKTTNAPTAETMRILYGGSVSDEKAKGFLKQPDIDGFLVGGASLNPQKFAGIIRATQRPQ